MFAFLAVFLIVCWLLGFVVFHVSAYAIHLLIIFAVVALVVHLVSGRRTI
jgi:hypothetical protein